MTLYDFLVIQMGTQAHKAMSSFSDDKDFYKNIGGVHMCEHLINSLSDETLKTTVTTRSESFKKG